MDNKLNSTKDREARRYYFLHCVFLHQSGAYFGYKIGHGLNLDVGAMSDYLVSCFPGRLLGRFVLCGRTLYVHHVHLLPSDVDLRYLGFQQFFVTRRCPHCRGSEHLATIDDAAMSLVQLKCVSLTTGPVSSYDSSFSQGLI